MLDEDHNNGEEIIDDVGNQSDTILEEFIEGEAEDEYYGEQKLDYIHVQAEIILSNIDRKIMWDKYKYFVDEIIFTGLQDATLCRYEIHTYNKMIKYYNFKIFNYLFKINTLKNSQ